MSLRKDRSINLVRMSQLEFNEEHFAYTPIETELDRGSRIDIELEELNTYTRVLTNLKQNLVIPIQDIILSLSSETHGLRCVKRICSHLIVVEEMVVKFHKYSVMYFKNTAIAEERRIFINCASCLTATIKAWEEYLVAYAEADAFEAFEEVAKLPSAHEIIERGYTEFAEFCNHSLEGSSHKESSNAKLSLKLSSLLLIFHEERASIVVLSNELYVSMGTHTEKNESDFKMSCDKLARLTERKRNLHNQVEVTRKFWNEHPKLLNCLEVKSIKKLIILTSKDRKLNYVKWSSHTIGFVLFQDSLLKYTIDFMGNYDAQTLPLTLLWVYAGKSKPESRLQIQLISPEAHLVLQCNSQDDRDYWVKAINEATIDYLGAPRQEITNKRIESTSSLLWPPPVRKTAYVFQLGQYQGAKYIGFWVDGKQNGRGTCNWPDGKLYVGYFRKGLFHGTGSLKIPHVIENEGKRMEVYDGNFKEGLYHGQGILSYANGDRYEGEWSKGQRQGYGKFSLTRNNQYSMYIGEWANGKRNGFGVENATDAEKSYHGMWKDDIREGQGFTITTGDLYCSCRFRENLLAGRGFIINGTGRSYEGWLNGEMGINGSGELRLEDNTVINGAFNGKWSDWIGIGTELKVTTGFITKQEVTRKSQRFDFINWEEKALKYSVCSDMKWCSLFEKCKIVLHLVEKEPDPHSSYSRSKSYRGKSADQEQTISGCHRANTINNGKPHPIKKSGTMVGINGHTNVISSPVNSFDITVGSVNSFDITVGSVTSPLSSTPDIEEMKKDLQLDLKTVFRRSRSLSNPEEYAQEENKPVERRYSVNIYNDEFRKSELESMPPLSQTPNSKRCSPNFDSEPELFSEFNSLNQSSPQTTQGLMFQSLDWGGTTDTKVINQIKKTLFDKLNTYFSSNTHALGKLVKDLSDVILESYAGIGASQYLLPHAIQDTKIFLKKLAEIVQKFAPFMMDDQVEIIEENIHMLDSYFLSDLFISRIYHTLFTLFSLFQAKNDSQYEIAVSILSHMRCSDLMLLFGIQNVPSDLDWYNRASQILSTITHEYTIEGKLNILKRSVNTMLASLKDCSSELTTDVIIPYFQIVIVYARVQKMSTELHYIYTFMDPRLSQGEFGFLLTLLEGCYMMLTPDKLPCRL
ncbi:Alsin-like [Oopsacas minuta]|uniref:Alsin-like n=1 Tax=Oopsacas minuta TaxID=111878 RepID=A0AAV7K733_9METZ|nr:Alsin-like [Oopsacas minuta]